MTALETLVLARSRRADLESRFGETAVTLGEEFAGGKTAWSAIESALGKVQRIKEFGVPSPAMLRWLEVAPAEREALSLLVQGAQSAMGALGSRQVSRLEATRGGQKRRFSVGSCELLRFGFR